MKSTLEKIIKGVGAFYLTTQLLLPAPFLPNYHPTALHAQTTEQEAQKKEKKKKKKPEEQSIREYLENQKRKKQKAVKTITPKTCSTDLTGIV
ncbi:unnamed protein product, partial [marine sediment metagenome]